MTKGDIRAAPEGRPAFDEERVNVATSTGELVDAHVSKLPLRGRFSRILVRNRELSGLVMGRLRAMAACRRTILSDHNSLALLALRCGV